MPRAGGYIVVLPQHRRALLEERIAEDGFFAEPVPEFTHSRHSPLVCFVVSQGSMTHVALGRRGTRSGTDLRRLNLEKVERLAPPVSIRRMLGLLPNPSRASVERRLSRGGLLTDAGFDAIAAAVRRLSPSSIQILDRFSQERYERVRRLTPQARQALAYQKESVLTALSIAGISRDPIQEWTPPADEPPRSFLDGLPTARLREDPMVVHDLSLLPGFEAVHRYPYSAAVFESGLERVTIVLANRLPLEQQTGSDLIYFNETFQSFVMVQYKAMDRDQAGEAEFRLPNAQLSDEIERMDRLLARLRKCATNTSHDGFRLTDNPFFLKMCPRLVFDPDDIGLIPGMYLPLDYWKLLESSPSIVGPRGGHRITYSSVGRYFDNTSFVGIVTKAWVGTTPSQSAVLASVIRETLATGRAVAIAVKPRRAAARRPLID